jgi:surface carbohydrate biosynthesis protein
MFLYYKKVHTLLYVLLRSKKTFFAPSPCELLIFDENFPKILSTYLKNYNYSTLSVRGESINLYVLIKSVLKLEFWTKNPFTTYIDSYIKITNPKIILTFIDNNPYFYLIKKRFKNKIFIFVQNGMRMNRKDDIFGIIKRNKDFRVDYMCVHNKFIGKKYNEYIVGKVIPIGNFLNNAFISKRKIIKDQIVFISQYVPESDSNLDSTQDWNKFYASEKVILIFLKDWCRKNKKKLVIAGRSTGIDNLEKDFFQEIMEESPYKFISNKNGKASYDLISSAEIVVSIDSTLGLEALSRNKKVACMSIRETSDVTRHLFGWPANLPIDGPFWTNQIRHERFEQILDFLNLVPDYEWKDIYSKYITKIMIFNPGNTVFHNLLKQLLKN